MVKKFELSKTYYLQWIGKLDLEEMEMTFEKIKTDKI